MERLPWGAEVFKAEVADRYPEATFEYADRDGLGVYRALRVTIPTEDALHELCSLIEPILESSDNRITGWIGKSRTEPDTVTFLFTGTDEAENSTPFYLARVADTLLPEKKPAKKAAKKAAPKT
jgi:hypothetical protein